MPSFQHELFVELFRSRPELARELLRACAGIEIRGSVIELGPTDLSQLAPAQYLADCVAIVREAEQAVAAIVIEIQLSADPDKRFTWPVYVAALRARLRCPVILVVLAPDDPVARWARDPIELGHPAFRLAPIVIASRDLPRLTDPAAAAAAPELAVLSVLGHPELEVAEAALAAIFQLPDPRRELYLDVVLGAIPDSLIELVEAHMIKHEYQSDFARKYFSQGRQEGLQEGRQEGIREGRQEGIREGRQEGIREGRQEGIREGRQEGTRQGLQDAVLAIVRAKLGALSDDEAARIRAIDDDARLTELVVALGDARDAAETRGALDRLARG